MIVADGGAWVTPAALELQPFLPDLVNATPSLSIDHGEVAQRLCIAFTTGDAERSLERVMDRARVCASTWGGSSFHEGLYMDVLLSSCMGIDLGDLRPQPNRTYLLRLLGNPPRDAATRDFRREILAELTADPALRHAFASTYRRIHDLRDELQAIDNVGYYDSRVRRFFVLGLLRDLFESLRLPFAHARSGLRRISAYAERVCRSDAYRYLCDLLAYDERLSSVQFKMRVGADGRMRSFEVLDIRENEDNPFYQTPFRRLVSKLAMWFRGYKVGESGLLDAWLDEVFQRMVPWLPSLFQMFGDQELYLAGLAFRDLCDRQGLPTSFPEILEPEARGEPFAEGLFNPLLFTQGARPVACALDASSLTARTILTGPNSGGKTRLLQALGITQILGECGLFAPVQRARLVRANGLFVSLIEESSVDQDEGRLGKELLRIRRLFETSRPGVLVMLDELCSGTNPSEGEEIFRLVLSLLGELDARAVVATHLLDFARRLASEGVDAKAARLAFLQVDARPGDRPTYQFRPGVATSSMAHEIAQRLGVTDTVLRDLVRQKRLAAAS